MNRYQFPEGFFWGAAASGPQTEGFANKPHRSIWDSWYAEQPNRFFQQIGPQKVCETYSKYKEDVALMKQTKKMASWRRRLHLTLCWRMQKRCTCTGNLSYRAK